MNYHRHDRMRQTEVTCRNQIQGKAGSRSGAYTKSHTLGQERGFQDKLEVLLPRYIAVAERFQESISLDDPEVSLLNGQLMNSYSEGRYMQSIYTIGKMAVHSLVRSVDRFEARQGRYKGRNLSTEALTNTERYRRMDVSGGVLEVEPKISSFDSKLEVLRKQKKTDKLIEKIDQLTKKVSNNQRSFDSNVENELAVKRREEDEAKKPLKRVGLGIGSQVIEPNTNLGGVKTKMKPQNSGINVINTEKPRKHSSLTPIEFSPTKPNSLQITKFDSFSTPKRQQLHIHDSNVDIQAAVDDHTGMRDGDTCDRPVWQVSVDAMNDRSDDGVCVAVVADGESRDRRQSRNRGDNDDNGDYDDGRGQETNGSHEENRDCGDDEYDRSEEQNWDHGDKDNHRVQGKKENGGIHRDYRGKREELRVEDKNGKASINELDNKKILKIDPHAPSLRLEKQKSPSRRGLSNRKPVIPSFSKQKKTSNATTPKKLALEPIFSSKSTNPKAVVKKPLLFSQTPKTPPKSLLKIESRASDKKKSKIQSKIPSRGVSPKPKSIPSPQNISQKSTTPIKNIKPASPINRPSSKSFIKQFTSNTKNESKYTELNDKHVINDAGDVIDGMAMIDDGGVANNENDLCPVSGVSKTNDGKYEPVYRVDEVKKLNDRLKTKSSSPKSRIGGRLELSPNMKADLHKLQTKVRIQSVGASMMLNTQTENVSVFEKNESPTPIQQGGLIKSAKSQSRKDNSSAEKSKSSNSSTDSQEDAKSRHIRVLKDRINQLQSMTQPNSNSGIITDMRSKIDACSNIQILDLSIEDDPHDTMGHKHLTPNSNGIDNVFNRKDKKRFTKKQTIINTKETKEFQNNKYRDDIEENHNQNKTNFPKQSRSSLKKSILTEIPEERVEKRRLYFAYGPGSKHRRTVSNSQKSRKAARSRRGSLNLPRSPLSVRPEERPAEKRVPTKYSEKRKQKLQNKKMPGPAAMIRNMVRNIKEQVEEKQKQYDDVLHESYVEISRSRSKSRHSPDNESIFWTTSVANYSTQRSRNGSTARHPEIGSMKSM